VRLRIAVPRPEKADTVVGGFARATIQGRSGRPVLTAPGTAVVSDDGERGVYLLEEDRVQWRAVRVGAANGDRIEIMAGLREGDRVVVKGADALSDGQTVAVKA
jgi:multidrug efflux pump subunit AcrA (membrane-fusion protein)